MYTLLAYLGIGLFLLIYLMIIQIPPLLKRGDEITFKRFLWVAPMLLFGWMFIAIKLLLDEIYEEW